MRTWQRGPRGEFDAVVFRTDYSDTLGWIDVVGNLRRPWGPDGEIPASPLYLVDDGDWEGASSADVFEAVADEEDLTVVFLADEQTFASAERPLLAVTTLGPDDLDDEDYADLAEFGTEFRVPAAHVCEVNSNLATGNMDFEKFAAAAADAADGYFRGFDQS